MRHDADPQDVARRAGPAADGMLAAVEACVHCGFCLAACPTYELLGEEMDSPRGRIVLMKEVLEGRLAAAEARSYVDRCVGCLACEPACPSGVGYRHLLHPYRALAGAEAPPPLGERLRRALLLRLLPSPRRFRAALALGRLARPFASLLPSTLRPAIDLLPRPAPRAARRRLPAHTPAAGPRRARVALLAGCVQRVLAPEIGGATLAVLAANGVEVVVPPAQGCCGALAAHEGAAPLARVLARRNLAAFPADVDAVVTDAAGCGSGMKEYAALFRGEPEEERARAVAEQTVDVAAFLDALGPVAPRPLDSPLRVAYQDACHLAHAQGVRAAPRRLLESIPGLTLVAPPDDLCCGSAGTYNLEQPELAAELGRRKAAALAALEPDLVASGNIGCIVQLRVHLERLGSRLPVVHTVEVLARAWGGGGGGAK